MMYRRVAMSITPSAKPVHRMFLGLDLHSWEDAMIGSLAAVALATCTVIILQRSEVAQAKREVGGIQGRRGHHNRRRDRAGEEG